MKLTTSIRNARKIHDRLKRLGGIIGTPECEYKAFKFRRVWLFGSTVKGKLNPNDTDILFEGFECDSRCMRPIGCCRNFSEDYVGKGDYKKWSVAKGSVSCGLTFGRESHTQALRSLRHGMKNIRFHSVALDGDFGDIPQTKVMIYPKWEVL